MASVLNLHTFYFVLIFACSFLEIYGKGFGGSRGGFGGSRGGGYSSRGSSSSRSSSGSSYKPSSSRSSSGSSYKPSSSHSSKSSSSHSSWPSSSGSSGSSRGSSGSSIKRGSSYPILPVPVYNNHRNRMYGGSSDLGGNNNDDVRVSPNHYERKIDDTETRRPLAPYYTTSRPWYIRKVNPPSPSDSWRREPIRRFESLPPSYRRQMERIYDVSKEMHELPEPFGNRRHRFQKRHACDGSQCIHKERREMGDDAPTVNISPSLDMIRNTEAKEEKPRHLTPDSQIDQETQPNVM